MYIYIALYIRTNDETSKLERQRSNADNKHLNYYSI